VELGVTFFDTADVYGDGHSERLLGTLRQQASVPLVIATKAGRRDSPHTADNYTLPALSRYVERSLGQLGVEALELLQIHCPPADVYDRPEVFAALDELKRQGKLVHYGVSVERVDQALKAIEYEGVETVQIVYNLFRQKPAELFFAEAKRKNIGVIARLPLSSGLLTGKLRSDTAFAPEDHRNYNRHGEAFDAGETFSGIDYETGLELVDELRALVPKGIKMSAFALRWALMHDAITTVIPGAKSVQQVEQNAASSELAALDSETMARISELYQERVRPLVHDRW
jgi:aryl-alcohol dehydrogenase-like predicted oxidoreductase